MASTSTCYIYTNGIIYTVATDDWDTEPQEAIVVQDGIIKYVGTNEEAYEFDIPGKQIQLKIVFTFFEGLQLCNHT